jgi:hypothetical protein
MAVSDKIAGFVFPGYDPLQVPNPPTITNSPGNTSPDVEFTAPTNTGGGVITSYIGTATKTSDGTTVESVVTASPASFSGLDEAEYTFAVFAINAYGPSGSSNTHTATLVTAGQSAYTTDGNYSWVAPSGVTSVSIVAVGAGGGSNTFPNSGSRTGGSGGGGGGLGYKNNISVTAGNSYTVVVGGGGRGAYGGGSSSDANVIGNRNFAEDGAGSGFNGVTYATGGEGGGNGSSGQYYGGAGGSNTAAADGGGTGGTGGSNSNVQSYWGFGGGAAGYSGNGGNGGVWQAGGAYTPGSSGGTGGGAGGAADWSKQCGVGLNGEGASGAVNQAGSGGTFGNVGYSGGGASTPGTGVSSAMLGAPGGVRIIYPGASRQYPSTNTGDL